jgi:glycosyltransferase involved in cell wall biosynthesis
MSLLTIRTNGVAFLSDNDHGGGIATQAHLLANAEDSPYLAVFGPSYHLGDNCHQRILCCSSFRALLAATSRVMRHGPQVVTFVSYHHETISRRRKGWGAPVLRLALKILGARNVAGYDTSSVGALPACHPVPLGLLGPVPQTGLAGWSARKAVVVAPARFVDFKFPGLKQLIETARQFPEVDFVLIGSGPREASLRQLAAQCPNVHFPGLLPYDQLLRQIAGARLCVAMGTTILDALAMGTPVLVNQADTKRFMLLDELPYPNYGDVLTGVRQGEGDVVEAAIRSMVLTEPDAGAAPCELLLRNNSLVLKNYDAFFIAARPLGRLRAALIWALVAVAALVKKSGES